MKNLQEMNWKMGKRQFPRGEISIARITYDAWRAIVAHTSDYTPETQIGSVKLCRAPFKQFRANDIQLMFPDLSKVTMAEYQYAMTNGKARRKDCGEYWYLRLYLVPLHVDLSELELIEDIAINETFVSCADCTGKALLNIQANGYHGYPETTALALYLWLWKRYYQHLTHEQIIRAWDTNKNLMDDVQERLSEDRHFANATLRSVLDSISDQEGWRKLTHRQKLKFGHSNDYRLCPLPQ